ncbi:acetate kinase [uncultured Campylobacter sp.]|uniref:acetate kinase n=1 Tax=uncultured Campylobacter sp. TaxID=218934 RepID=UPI00260B7D75|nr:acetate kinase [uncultured Campylobacter sp.]
MDILVINSGSSSVKFKFYDIKNHACIASGLIEEIGSTHANGRLNCVNGQFAEVKGENIPDHETAIAMAINLLKQNGAIKDLSEVGGIGHRIVQGADYFDAPALIDEDVMAKIAELAPLAPLHNPANLAGIKSCLKIAPKIPNVAVFDTIFHQSIPPYAYMYALPYEFYEKYKVRRYGAHGTSHGFVSQEGAKFLGIEYEKFNAITLHLGNGSSVSAIENGKCIDTSMGLTPLEGIIMGTRCGSIDPAIIPYIERVAGYNAQDMDVIMNKKSGLLGICGASDLRKVYEKMEGGEPRAKLAFEMLVYSVVKMIGAYYAVLGRVDALIFAGGIGENAPHFRENVCERLAHIGIAIEPEKNYNNTGSIRNLSAAGSKIQTLVIPTNEELAIAEATVDTINKNSKF